MKRLVLAMSLTAIVLNASSMVAHPVLPSTPLLSTVGIMLQQDPRTGNFPNEPPEYEPGVMCTPHGDNYKGLQTPDHPCTCKNMYRDSGDDTEEGCNERVTNDAACKQWCHESHCACPRICVPGKPDETATPRNDEAPQ